MKEFNNKWQVKSLGEVCEIIGGNPAPKGDDAFQSDGLPFVKMKDVGKYHLTNNLIDIENRVSPETAKKNRLKLINRGSILLPRSGSVALNHRAILGMDAYMVSHLCALEIKDLASAYNQFLYYYLTTINFSNITKKTTGLDALTFEDLAKVKIPLPPLPIQKQIAEILEKADQAKQKRKEANKLTDEFLQSVFIEMFGDPGTNPKGFPIGPLEKVCTKITDGTHNSPKNDENGIYKYVTAKNIKKNGIDLKNITYINEVDHKAIYSRCNPEFEDVLYIKDGVTTGIAQVNTLKEEFSMLSSLALFKLNKSILNPYYLRDYLNNNNVYQNIRNSMGGAAITRLTVDKLKRIKVVVPTFSLQQQFAEIVNKTEALKEKQKQSEQELETLFQSLMQKAFKGELV